MWPFKKRAEATIQGVPIRSRTGGLRPANINQDTALRHSAVWACCRLRADLLSTFPTDVFRNVNGVRVEVAKPPVLVAPGGEEWDWVHWAWATQFDLDRCGNTVGIITEISEDNRPARIDLQDISSVSIFKRKNEDFIRYRIDNREYTPEKIWHERQFMVAGSPIGLSPISYAAWTINEQLSSQNWAQQWWDNGGTPKQHLRNKAKKVDFKEAAIMKDRFKASMSHGDTFVSGVDWELDMISAQQMGMEWLESRKASVPEICRWFGAPADLIEAAISGQSVTYANIVQRNLQFLIMNLEPAVVRRETVISRKLLTGPRYMKMNTRALLRMDPKTQAEVFKILVADLKAMTVTEVRNLLDLPPLTQAQLDEIEKIAAIGAKAKPPVNEDPTKQLSYEQVSPWSAIPYHQEA